MILALFYFDLCCWGRSLDFETTGVPIIGVAGIFDWGGGGGGRGANHKSPIITSSKIFKKGTFYGKKYRRMENEKRWPGLAFKKNFAKEYGFKQ